jgi:hypothetical protein
MASFLSEDDIECEIIHVMKDRRMGTLARRVFQRLGQEWSSYRRNGFLSCYAIHFLGMSGRFVIPILRSRARHYSSCPLGLYASRAGVPTLRFAK